MIAFLFLSVFLLMNTVVCDEEKFTGEGDGSIRIVTVEEAENREQKSKDGDFLVIKYTAEYTDTGEQFDKSDSKSDPFYFKLGDGQVLSGWEKGLRGMCVGDKRDVYLTGNELNSDKPTAAVTPDKERGEVVYHFELIKILEKPPTPNLFKKMDFDGDNQISKTEMKAFFSAQGLGGLKEDESLDSAVENIFDFQDKDKDGTISFEEFPGQKHDEL